MEVIALPTQRSATQLHNKCTAVPGARSMRARDRAGGRGRGGGVRRYGTRSSGSGANRSATQSRWEPEQLVKARVRGGRARRQAGLGTRQRQGAAQGSGTGVRHRSESWVTPGDDQQRKECKPAQPVQARVRSGAQESSRRQAGRGTRQR
eukprot:4987557-Prymnesium_polylepis.1